MQQKGQFDCLIHDRILGETCTAKVVVIKKDSVEISRQRGKIALASALITPAMGQRIKAWEKHDSVHHHFLLYDLDGNGWYIVRNWFGNTEKEYACSIWDLGAPFGYMFMEEFNKML